GLIFPFHSLPENRSEYECMVEVLEIDSKFYTLENWLRGFREFRELRGLRAIFSTLIPQLSTLTPHLSSFNPV
ncbi:MAG: hypothetical protein RL447_1277, partial [Bacteroidota bacterium]